MTVYLPILYSRTPLLLNDLCNFDPLIGYLGPLIFEQLYKSFNKQKSCNRSNKNLNTIHIYTRVNLNQKRGHFL